MDDNGTVLLIDDEPDFLSCMRFFLESARFRVVTASNPIEGLMKARLKPDLILLDLKMEGMDGHAVCRRLKEDAVTLHIPVIMLTSNTRTIDKVTAFDLGAADYIGKSFPLEEILARIKSVLKATSQETIDGSVGEKNKKVLELRRVLDEKDIRILFQPILNLSTKIPIGYEALARGPKGSFLENPMDLFAFAAETDMLFELDTLCRELAVKKATFLKKGESIFLNTDPSVISTEIFQKLKFLEGSTVAPAQVCIEITERTCVKNFSALSMYLKDMRVKGVKIAIDDVGEGYSSLNAIAELKPQFMKIDITIVRDVDSDSVKHNLVKLIAGLAASINSRLIAEGVETEEECKKLVSLGVENGQGYLFARPA